MRDRISSYKLSPQLRAELGTGRSRARSSKSSGTSFDLSFELPHFLPSHKPKIPWRAIATTVFVIVVIIGSYTGAKAAYDFAKDKAYEAEQARVQQYQSSLASIRDEVSTQASDAYSFVELSQKYLKDGNGERAVTAAEIATEKDPLWRDGYLNLGQIYLSVNDFDKAKLALESALDKDPTYGQTHYLLSLALGGLNDKEGSKQELSKANKFGYDSDIGG